MAIFKKPDPLMPVRWNFRLDKPSFLRKSRKYLFKRVPFRKSILKCNDSTFYIEMKRTFYSSMGDFGDFVGSQNANAISVNFPMFIIEFKDPESALFTKLMHAEHIQDWKNVKEVY